MAPVFTGKTALITGAGRGIGRAIALGLADAGAALEGGRVDILVNNAATVEPLGVTAAIPAAELRGDDSGSIWDVSDASARV